MSDGRVVEAQPGDLLVCYRISRYQRISNLNGDPCAHVAILDVREGRAVTAEMGPPGVFERTLETFARRYDWFAVVHLDASTAQRQVIVDAARRALVDQHLRYSHAQCVAIGSFAFARRWLLPFAGPVLSRVARAGARLAHRVNGGSRATCSGFVAQCLVPAGVVDAMVLPARRRPRGFTRVRLADLRRWDQPGGRAAVPAGPWAVMASPSDVLVCVAHTHLSAFGLTGVEVVHRPGTQGPLVLA